MQHLCITVPKYGGLYRKFYDIRNTQFLSFFLVIRMQKWTMTDRLWSKRATLSNHVTLYDKLWTSLSKVPFLIDTTARPLYFILIQPKRWYFCDKIKLLDSCRWNIRVFTRQKTLSIVLEIYRSYVNILIELNFVMFNRRMHLPKYTVSNIISNSLIINELYWKKCILLTGGLEVSFSIVLSVMCLTHTQELIWFSNCARLSHIDLFDNPNYNLARSDFCRLLTAFAISLDTGQDQHNLCPDLNPTCFLAHFWVW